MDIQALLTAVAGLSRAATGEFAVEDMLRSLCTAAAAALGVDGAGVMIREGGRNRFVHASTAAVEPLERLQEILQQGPCADCVRTGAAIVVSDLGAVDTWPDYRDLSVDLGISAVVALPLLSRGRGWGVLDLYRHRPGPWAADELAAARVLADVAVSYIVMAHDRDEARAAQVTLAHRALHDELTGLANRALLFDRLEHALASAARQGTGVAVVFADLDMFKLINDAFGHAAGDAVLMEVAARFAATLRGSDTLARLAGDEFVLVCEGLPQDTAAALGERVRALTARLLAALAPPVHIGRVDVVVGASIGVAVTTGTSTARELIGDADAAMYTAKEAGRGRVSIRDHAATTAAGHHRRLERDLTGALDRGELLVHYQPIISSVTGKVAAVEALLRWDRPGGAVLPAVAFIDIAVRTGLIVGIGRWVINETAAQLARWRRDLPDVAPATAFVNLSSRELADAALPAVIAAALAGNELEPAQLGLEIVEHDLSDPAAGERLAEYHRLGHPLAVDDFGTGYSSLSRLLDLPVDLAKIDRSFVRGLPADPRSVRLVGGVLLMAATLDIRVVAEGVETADQVAYLTRIGCQLLQGYRLGRPQSAADLALGWAS